MDKDKIRGILDSMIPELTEREKGEYFTEHYNRYVETISLIRAPPGAKVLDVGTLHGHQAVVLKELGYDVCGLDKDPSPWRKRFRDRGIEVLSCDIEGETFPFEDESFDCILFTEVINYLGYSPRHTIGEIYRVLKIGGELVVTSTNAARLKNRLRMLLGKNIHLEMDLFDSREGRLHREYTMDEIRKLLREQGLRVEKTGYTLPWDKGASLSNIIKKLHPPLRDDLMLYVTKTVT